MAGKITRRVVAGAAVTSLVGGMLAVGAGSPAYAADGGCSPAGAAPPTANTWYDQQDNYRGTRIAHRYNNYHLVDTVYDTYGPGYRQIEVWASGGFLPPERISCERKPDNPATEPEEPTVTPVGPVEYRISFPSFGFSRILVGSPAPRKGKVTVGDVEQVE